MIVIEDNRAGGVYDMPLGTLLEDVARNAIAAARRTRKTIYVFYASGRYFGVTDPIENSITVVHPNRGDFPDRVHFERVMAKLHPMSVLSSEQRHYDYSAKGNRARGKSAATPKEAYVARFPSDFHAQRFVDYVNAEAKERAAWIKPGTTSTVVLVPPPGTDPELVGVVVRRHLGVVSIQPIAWKGRMIPGGLRPTPYDPRGSRDRAVGGRLTPEERSDAPSKLERKLADPEAWRGFSIAPANDIEGKPGSIWVHREPDGAVVVRKLGGSQFVRIDPSGDGYEASVWYRGLRGEEPRLGRMNARRTTIDAAVTWGKDLLTREEREVETRQRMEAGTEEGGELPVGAVVRFRDRGARRRYVVARVMHFGSGENAWTDYYLVALSGGEAGSGSSGIRREHVVLDADQTVQFKGAIARKLERQFEYYSSQRSV